VAQSERQRRETQQTRVANVVASVLTDADADLFNLADAVVNDDPRFAVIALAKLAAAAVEQQATLTGTNPVDALRAVALSAFGHTPVIE